MNKEKIISKKDVIATIDNAVMYKEEFLSSHSFDPYDLIMGGSGYPDANQLEYELFEANCNFLDDILKAMEKRENRYNLNKNNTIYCTWNTKEG